MKIINFRVDDAEHTLMHAIAEAAGMTLSAYIRQHFKTIAIAEGLVPNPLDALRLKPAAAETATKIERRPIPTAPNAWRTEMMHRADAGEPIADIAASYGVSFQVVKEKIKAAREDEQYRAAAESQAPAQGDLVYAPADPDNPTEEEQAINAEIARRKLESMGFTL